MTNFLVQRRSCSRPSENGDTGADSLRRQDGNSECLERSLSDVMVLINPIITSTVNDSALVEAMLADDLYGEPLSKHEFTVLACALYNELRTVGAGFDYGKVVELTDRFRGRPMNTTMIYKTVVALETRGLIASIGKDKSARGRAADHFVVTNNGRAAFRLATSNALFLKCSRESVAA